MRLPPNRTLVIVLVVLVGAWVFLRSRTPMRLPWNQGQAGSIFDGRHAGGGQ